MMEALRVADACSEATTLLILSCSCGDRMSKFLGNLDNCDNVDGGDLVRRKVFCELQKKWG